MKNCLSLDIMAEHIGAAPTARLVQHYGGLNIRIPKLRRGKAYAELLALLGEEAAHELMRVYGGEHLYLAKDAQAMRQIHRQAIAKERAAGKSWQQVARDYSFKTTFSERWVRKLGQADKAEQSRRQPCLFDNIPAPHPLDALSRRT